MGTLATGQITIVDLYDAPALNAWLGASLNTTQTYNNSSKTYSPDYSKSMQVITLNLTRAGSTDDIISSDAVSNIKWTKVTGNNSEVVSSTVNTDVDYISGTAGSIMNTKSNVPTAQNTIRWVCEGTYTDPDTELPIDFQASIDIRLLQLAKAALIINLYAPEGDTFRNGTPASIKAVCDLYKDGTLYDGQRKFKWFAADPSVITSQDSDAGVGWKKVTATTGTTGAVANSGFDVSVTIQGVLTVYPDAVTNAQVFLIVATDNDGGKSGEKMKQYITLKDMADPFGLTVESSEGSIFKNGVGSTTLKARLYQNGEEVDASGSTYTYRWSKWEKGVMVSDFGGKDNPYKMGKSITVGSDDVNSKSVFNIEVITK